MPDNRHRRSHRLQGYDYASPGAYFITLCTYQRQCLFGEIIDGQMQLNEFGHIVATEWQQSAQIRQEIALDAWVVMPNHFHGIVFITPPRTAKPPSPSGSDRVGAIGQSPLQPRVNSDPTSSGKQGIMPLMRPKSLSSLIVGFKSAATKRINCQRNARGTPVWQRNYHDHIIRDDTALRHLRRYIHNNPAIWQEDQLHPDHPSKW